VSLPRVSESLPFTFTGADLYALCSDAMLKAVTRSARAVDDRVAIINADRAKRGQNNISIAYYFDHYDSEADAQVMVTEEDFALARRDLVPSVSVDELRHYEHVRSTFEGATKKPASNGEVERPSSTPRNNGAAPTSPRSKSLRIGSLRGSNRGNGERTPSVTSRSAISAADDLDGDADTDDDFVIRTDRLALNTDAGRGSPGKGKGKGKSRDLDGEALMSPQIRVAGDDDGDDGEDLYD
jgi:peroxin-6